MPPSALQPLSGSCLHISISYNPKVISSACRCCWTDPPAPPPLAVRPAGPAAPGATSAAGRRLPQAAATQPNPPNPPLSALRRWPRCRRRCSRGLMLQAAQRAAVPAGLEAAVLRRPRLHRCRHPGMAAVSTSRRHLTRDIQTCSMQRGTPRKEGSDAVEACGQLRFWAAIAANPTPAATAADTDAVDVAAAAAPALRRLPAAPSDASATPWPTSGCRSAVAGPGDDGSAAAAAASAWRKYTAGVSVAAHIGQMLQCGA